MAAAASERLGGAHIEPTGPRERGGLRKNPGRPPPPRPPPRRQRGLGGHIGTTPPRKRARGGADRPCGVREAWGLTSNLPRRGNGPGGERSSPPGPFPSSWSSWDNPSFMSEHMNDSTDQHRQDRQFLWHPFTQMRDWEREEPLF